MPIELDRFATGEAEFVATGEDARRLLQLLVKADVRFELPARTNPVAYVTIVFNPLTDETRKEKIENLAQDDLFSLELT